jgi:hypothetical protein
MTTLLPGCRPLSGSVLQDRDDNTYLDVCLWPYQFSYDSDNDTFPWMQAFVQMSLATIWLQDSDDNTYLDVCLWPDQFSYDSDNDTFPWMQAFVQINLAMIW